jgi:hypothetical protein
MRQLLPACLLTLVSGASAAGTAQVVGSTIDTQGFDSLTVFANIGAVTATGTATLKLMGGDAADGSDKAAIAGASVVATDADGNKKIAIEVHRPSQRYITAVIDRATANSVIVSVEAILFGASQEPVTQSGVAKSIALVNSPLA